MRDPAEDERELMDLDERTHQAFLRSDGESLDRILTEPFIFTDADGTVVTKAEYIADNTRGVTFDSIATDDLQLRLFGDAAVTLGRVSMKGTAGNVRFDTTYGFTPPTRGSTGGGNSWPST